MKILIADDHDLLRDTLAMFLEGEGNIETVTASDFDGAMALVDAQGSFDLIMDIIGQTAPLSLKFNHLLHSNLLYSRGRKNPIITDPHFLLDLWCVCRSLHLRGHQEARSLQIAFQ